MGALSELCVSLVRCTVMSQLVHIFYWSTCYRKPEPEQPLAYFVAVLKLSTLWIHGWGRKHAIKCLDDHPNLTTSLRVHVARKHHVHEWLLPAFRSLCLTPPTNLSKLDVAYMGVDFYEQVVRTRHELFLQRMSVAYTPPPFEIDKKKCKGPVHCSGEEGWKKAWWEHAARRLHRPGKHIDLWEIATYLRERCDISDICAHCCDSVLYTLAGQAGYLKDAVDAIIKEGGEKVAFMSTFIRDKELDFAGA